RWADNSPVTVAVVCVRGGCHLRDALGRLYQRKDYVRRAEPVQFRIELPFDVHLLEHVLDHDLGARHGLLEIDDPANFSEDAVHFGGGHLPLLDALRKRLADPTEPGVHEALLDVSHRDLEPGGGARLCGPATHRPRPDHRDLPHVGNAHRTTHRARNIRADLKNALRSIRQTHIGLAALRRLVPPMRHLRSLSAVIGLAVALASILIVSPPVAATQNHPSWPQRGFWVSMRHTR